MPFNQTLCKTEESLGKYQAIERIFQGIFWGVSQELAGNFYALPLNCLETSKGVLEKISLDFLGVSWEQHGEFSSFFFGMPRAIINYELSPS